MNKQSFIQRIMDMHYMAATLEPRQAVIALPEYRNGVYGDWELVDTRTTLIENAGARAIPHIDLGTVQYAYFRGKGLEEHYHILRERESKRVWMCTSLLEQESHLTHLNAISHMVRDNGPDNPLTVVVVGLGMGMILRNLCEMAGVGRIIVIDRDPDTIALLREATDFEQWPNKDRVEFIVHDALTIDKVWDTSIAVDYLYVDIWPTLGDEEACDQTKSIYDAIKPKAVSYWGQEIDFVHWCIIDPHAEKRFGEKLTPALVDWDRFRLKAGMPLYGKALRHRKAMRWSFLAVCAYMARADPVETKPKPGKDQKLEISPLVLV